MAQTRPVDSLHVALAVRAIARSRYEYNLGVLSVLGQRDLAIAHQLASVAVVRNKEEIERHENRHGPDAAWPDGARDAALRALSQAITLEESTWAPIQALIDSYPNIEDALFASSSNASL